LPWWRIPTSGSDRYRLRQWKQTPEPLDDVAVPGQAQVAAGERLVESAIGAQQPEQSGLIGFECGVRVVELTATDCQLTVADADAEPLIAMCTAMVA